jgi:hypothetical protein
MGRAAASILLGLAVLLGGASRSLAQSDQQAAEKLLKKGRALLDKGDFQEAVIVLMKAKAAAPSALIQLELAAAYEGLQSPIEAAQIYETLASDPGFFGKPKKRCEDRLAALRAKLGRLAIESEIKDALVTINGKEAGTTPLPLPVYVEPGEVTIVVKTPAQEIKVTREVKAGELQKVVVGKQELRKALVAPTIASPPPAPAPTPGVQPGAVAPAPYPEVPAGGGAPKPAARSKGREGFRPKILGLWTIAASLAVVTGVVGMGLGISASSDYRDYKSKDTSPSQWADYENRINTKSTTANVFFGITGGLVVTAAVLFLVEGMLERPSKRHATAAPGLSGGAGRVSLGTSF